MSNIDYDSLSKDTFLRFNLASNVNNGEKVCIFLRRSSLQDPKTPVDLFDIIWNKSEIIMKDGEQVTLLTRKDLKEVEANLGLDFQNYKSLTKEFDGANGNYILKGLNKSTIESLMDLTLLWIQKIDLASKIFIQQQETQHGLVQTAWYRSQNPHISNLEQADIVEANIASYDDDGHGHGYDDEEELGETFQP